MHQHTSHLRPDGSTFPPVTPDPPPPPGYVDPLAELEAEAETEVAPPDGGAEAVATEAVQDGDGGTDSPGGA